MCRFKLHRIIPHYACGDPGLHIEGFCLLTLGFSAFEGVCMVGKPEVCLTCIQLIDVAAFPWSSVLAVSTLSEPAPSESLSILLVLPSAYQSRPLSAMTQRQPWSGYETIQIARKPAGAAVKGVAQSTDCSMGVSVFLFRNQLKQGCLPPSICYTSFCVCL